MKPSTFVIIAAAAVIVGAAAPRATTAVVYQLGDDADGRPAGAGVYFVSLRAGGQEIRGAVVRISP